MDVIKSRREERITRMGIIQATLDKAFKDGLSVDYDFLIAQACKDWGCTWRYVQDIIKILRISLAFTIETNAGVKQIIPPEKKDGKKQGPG
ncbi:unnamed protein product [marine sediment metagenome]|uniref:Uncharacterized protein n=1 Tax=marine sediment metagenome TaxID=412755 RepID=X1HYG5_9ZZZZ